MKLKKIELKNFYQFKDFTLDLTYPMGHPKEGQPLDKVCFIGQSGTGKTTLLKLIRNSLCDLFNEFNNTFPIPEQPCTIEFEYELEGINFDYYALANIGIKGDIAFGYSYYPKIESEKIALNNLLNKIKAQRKIQYIYYPAEMSYNNIPPDFETEDQILIDFDKIQGNSALHFVLNKIKIYREQYLNFLLQLDNRINKDNSIDYNKERKKWSDENENPVEDLAKNCLDKLLNKFHLKTKTEFDDINKINLHVVNLTTSQVIPFSSLSTGTKQIICTSIPLFYLKEQKEAIILFDEPERSLYPDIQSEIIDVYTSMAEGSQFFFATHSAIILSNFEPWEIVELKFDEQDSENIVRDKYYRGENHVDNYFIDPRYMRWDTIYQKVYDFLPDGNSKERTPKLIELAMLEEKLKKMKSEKADKDLIDKTWEEYKKLAEKIGWETE